MKTLEQQQHAKPVEAKIAEVSDYADADAIMQDAAEAAKAQQEDADADAIMNDTAEAAKAPQEDADADAGDYDSEEKMLDAADVAAAAAVPSSSSTQKDGVYCVLCWIHFIVTLWMFDTF